MKRIITISREYGAGGNAVGHELAQKLGYEYYDKEIILKAARASNTDMESFLKFDEKLPTEFGFAQSLFGNKSLSDKIHGIQEDIIHDIGEKGHCVIAGRNANFILKDYQDSLHVFIYADMPWKIQYMKKEMPGATDEEIEEKIHEMDRARRRYCEYHTGMKFGQASSYDISLSTSTFGVEGCVELLYQLVTK